MATLSFGVFDVLKIRVYRVYRIGASASLLGSKMQAVSLAWIAWDVTHSGTWLGAIGFAELIPIAMIAPRAGLIANRFGSRVVIIATQIAGVIHSAALIAMLGLHSVEPWSLLFFGVTIGLVDGFFHPSNLNMVSELVDAKSISSAIAVHSSLQNLCVFLGPVAASVTMTMSGPIAACFASLILRVYFLYVLLVDADLKDRCRFTSHQKKGFDKLADGWPFFRESRSALMMLLSCAIVSLVGRSLIPVLSEYVSATLHQGPAAFGWAVGLVGAGAVFGGLSIGVSKRPETLYRLVRFGLLGTALSLGGLAQVTNSVIAFTLLFLLGVTLGLNGAGTQAFIQTLVHGQNRGRVLGIYITVLNASMAVGGLYTGRAIALYGPSVTFFVSSSLCILTFLLLNKTGRSTPT